MATTQKITTPIGELRWVIIDGEGKADLNGRMRYQASLVLQEGTPEYVQLQNQIDDFWEENKPKGATKPKSTGVHPVTDTGRRDGKPTGYHSFDFWTGTEFDGEPKVIKVYNAKAAEVSLHGKKIGNGSRGAISGSCGIYSNGPNKGVTLYLNAIQLVHFIEYTADAFEAVAEEGPVFTGVEAANPEGFTSV